MSASTGQMSLLIKARTAVFTGTFFNPSPTSDEDIRGSSVYTINIELIGNTWYSDVATSFIRRQALIDLILQSNRENVTDNPGYEAAMPAARQAYPQAYVTRVSDTTVSIQISALPTYALPGGGSETITAGGIPSAAQTGQANECIYTCVTTAV